MSFDLLFKKMFGDENHKERTAYLISTFLQLPYKEIKETIEILPNDKILYSRNDKRQARDVIVRIILSINMKVNLEMNVCFDESRRNRNLMYITHIYSNQLKNKEDYKKIEKCIQINFNLDYINKDKKEIIEKYTLKDKYNYESTDMLEIYHVNIYECHNIMYNKDIKKYDGKLHEIIRYGAMLVEKDYEKLRELVEELSMEEYSEDEDMAYYYDVEHDRMATYNGSISIAKEEGLNQGKQETKQEIAKRMKEENIDIEVISKCTGLTEEEIKKI